MFQLPARLSRVRRRNRAQKFDQLESATATSREELFVDVREGGRGCDGGGSSVALGTHRMARGEGVRADGKEHLSEKKTLDCG